MERRLVEPLERWLLDWPLAALALALLWRVGAGAFLWGQLGNVQHGLGLIEAQLVAVVMLGAAVALARVLVPRDYSAVAGLVCGGASYVLALTMLPRFGWLIHWPLAPLPRAWHILAAIAIVLALLANAYLQFRWRRQLRGHGIAWTKQWAWGKPYAARKLAVQALRYMGEWEAN